MNADLRAAYEAMLSELSAIDPDDEGLDPQAVASVCADINLALLLGRSVPGCGMDPLEC
jgi:hypothetical protein